MTATRSSMDPLLSSRTVSIKDRATMRYAEDNPYTKVIGKQGVHQGVCPELYGAHVALYIPSKGAKGATRHAQVQPIAATLTTLGARE